MIGSNAYGRYLFYNEPSLRNKALQLLSCSGDKIDGVVGGMSGPKKKPRGKSQLDLLGTLSPETFEVLTLSIGGNNVKVSQRATKREYLPRTILCSSV